MRLPVTYLFVPGDRPERFDRALGSGADVVILDLEDAVHPDKKAEARTGIAKWFRCTPVANKRTLVRINGAATPWFADDLAMFRALHGVGAMVPKAEARAVLKDVLAALGEEPVLVPLIESALGLRAIDIIAATQGVQRLAFGTLDFALDLGLSEDPRGLLMPASQIALASRCAGLAAPIAGVTAAIHDHEALASDIAFARALGFAAKLCIHPRQVSIVRAAFAPGAEELDWARRVVSAIAAGVGAAQVDGRMVDAAVLRRAQSIIERADSSSNQEAQ
jgi:citrate lyase subunit beta / citryl-CoA lyase